MRPMNSLAGVALICLGVAIAISGDRKLHVKEGRFLRILSPSGRWFRISRKIQKWVIGLLLIWFGLALIVG